MFDADESLLAAPASQLQRYLEHTQTARLSPLDLSSRDLLWSIDTAPEHLLPYLAQALSVDIWNPEWPVETKRNACRASLPAHWVKGTRGAVEDALAAIDAPIEIDEWWQQSPHGVPGTMKVNVDLNHSQNIFSVVDDARKALERTKRMTITYELSLNSSVATGAVCAQAAHGSVESTVNCSCEPDHLVTHAIAGHVGGGETYHEIQGSFQ